MKKVTILLISIFLLSCNMLDPNNGDGNGDGDGNGNENNNPYEVETEYNIDGLSSYVEYNNLPRLRGFDASVMDGYDSIEELADDLDRVAMEVGLQYIENIDSYYWYGAVDDVTLDGAPMEEASNGADDNDSGGYETNVQVSGVDEADSVKSDGTYIYTLYGTQLIISDLEGSETDRDSLLDGDYLAGMVLVNDTIIAYTSYNWDDSHNLVIADVSNGEVVSKSLETIPGNITDIRVSGDDVLIFSNTGFDYWVLWSELFDYEDYEYNGASDAEEPAPAPAEETSSSSEEVKVGSRALDKSEARERLKSTIPNWRNKIILDYFMTGDEVNTELLNDTQRIYDKVGVDSDEYVNALSGMQRLTTFNINSEIDSKSEALVFNSGWGSYIYTNGYVSVTASHGWTYDSGEWSEKTYLSAFLTENSETTPLSTGVFDGYVNNQFSMDFYDYDGTYGEGYFRIGLTQGEWWSPTSNDLYVIDLSTSTMEVVGEISGLGKPNERIMSMRFMGEKAFMVTFEQTDPFYTLDLSDPTNPQKAGELEIPGFSAYLHPINDDTLLAVGRSGDESGLDGGFQIVFYDVSDFSNPVQSLPYVLPNTWSESTWDHHAFRYYNGMLILPMSVYDYNLFFSGFKVFDINEETFEISERQAGIPHIPTYEDYYYEDYYYGYLNPRSMIFTGSNQIVTFKEGRIISSDMDTLDMNWTLSLD